MAGWVGAVVMRRGIQAVGGQSTADVKCGPPKRRRGRHAKPDACNQGLEREQTGYTSRQKATGPSVTYQRSYADHNKNITQPKWNA